MIRANQWNPWEKQWNLWEKRYWVAPTCEREGQRRDMLPIRSLVDEQKVEVVSGGCLSEERMMREWKISTPCPSFSKTKTKFEAYDSAVPNGCDKKQT